MVFIVADLNLGGAAGEGGGGAVFCMCVSGGGATAFLESPVCSNNQALLFL